MLEVEVIRGTDGWLADRSVWTTPTDFPEIVEAIAAIERRAEITGLTGQHPIWEGYKDLPNYRKSKRDYRSSDQVRSSTSMCLMFAWLAAARHSNAVIEIGAAFGISGMYWLSGLAEEEGWLFTFEANTIWADLARDNLRAISDRFTLVNGTFEEHADATLAGVGADIGVVDGFHTSDVVHAQLDILRRFLAPGALVLIVGVNFSPDMIECWRAISEDPSYAASAVIGPRVGLIELPRD
ncbi:MAG: class I SAM-dependent methyltransferase [Sphingomonadaceae bacterium]|nr:class I SAM-dependent methyltransferase [Sphingomonadaceae bacterium]